MDLFDQTIYICKMQKIFMNQRRKNKMETNNHSKTKIKEYWIKRFK